MINKVLLKKLSEMAKLDQEMRFGKLWDNSVDILNTKKLKKIITKYGWPDKTQVGKQGSTYAWLIVQHADHDMRFQQKCFDLMQEKAKQGLVENKHIALLQDRIQVNTHKKQIYGTQCFQDKKGNIALRPIKGIANTKKIPHNKLVALNKLRSKMGLNTIEDYLFKIKKSQKSSSK